MVIILAKGIGYILYLFMACSIIYKFFEFINNEINVEVTNFN